MHKSSSTTLSGNFAPNMFFSDEPGYYEDGNYGMQYSKLVPILINAVKELSAKNDALAAEVEQLKSQLNN